MTSIGAHRGGGGGPSTVRVGPQICPRTQPGRRPTGGMAPTAVASPRRAGPQRGVLTLRPLGHELLQAQTMWQLVPGRKHPWALVSRAEQRPCITTLLSGAQSRSPVLGREGRKNPGPRSWSTRSSSPTPHPRLPSQSPPDLRPGCPALLLPPWAQALSHPRGLEAALCPSGLWVLRCRQCGVCVGSNTTCESGLGCPSCWFSCLCLQDLGLVTARRASSALGACRALGSGDYPKPPHLGQRDKGGLAL